MKTVLRIGLILISVIAVRVARFAQSGTQPANQSSPNTPQPVSGTSAREDVVTKLIALRDAFLNEIKNNGFNPDPPADCHGQSARNWKLRIREKCSSHFTLASSLAGTKGDLFAASRAAGR